MRAAVVVVAAFLLCAVAVRATESEADAESLAEEGSEVSSTGKPPLTIPTPYVDPHWYHREQQTDNDLYALKLCCTTGRGIDEDGLEWGTCAQKWYWVCENPNGDCEYKPPKHFPKVPFRIDAACPACEKGSKFTHSATTGPCLCECSAVHRTRELASQESTSD